MKKKFRDQIHNMKKYVGCKRKENKREQKKRKKRKRKMDFLNSEIKFVIYIKCWVSNRVKENKTKQNKIK